MARAQGKEIFIPGVIVEALPKNLQEEFEVIPAGKGALCSR